MGMMDKKMAFRVEGGEAVNRVLTIQRSDGDPEVGVAHQRRPLCKDPQIGCPVDKVQPNLRLLVFQRRNYAAEVKAGLFWEIGL